LHAFFLDKLVSSKESTVVFAVEPTKPEVKFCGVALFETPEAERVPVLFHQQKPAISSAAFSRANHPVSRP
jgi:hypothetical protein